MKVLRIFGRRAVVDQYKGKPLLRRGIHVCDVDCIRVGIMKDDCWYAFDRVYLYHGVVELGPDDYVELVKMLGGRLELHVVLDTRSK